MTVATALSNRTYPAAHTLYESNYIGRESCMAESVREGNIVKDFKIGNTRIKICDDYCYSKTPEAVQGILERIAYKTETQLAMQQSVLQLHNE